MKNKILNEINLKTFTICAFIFSIFLLLQGCDQYQEDLTYYKEIDVLSISECKSSQDGLKRSSTINVPCVTIQTIDSNYIAIEHLNAIFNCFYEKITIDFSVTDNIINIKENQANAGARCSCNYDIKYNIGPVEYSHYTINIEDESQCNVISFEFDFSENTLVNYCNK